MNSSLKLKCQIAGLLVVGQCSFSQTVTSPAQPSVSPVIYGCSAVMPASPPKVGDAYHPDLGQGERKISARHVKWFDPRGFYRECEVVYDQETRQIVASDSPGKVRFFHGKFLSFRGGASAIDIVEAEPMAAAETDDKIFVEFAARNSEWGAGKVIKRVKLDMSGERQRITMAGVPLLEKVEPVVRNGNLVVKYTSPGLRSSKVVLDENLKIKD